jgi:hypothetical protein
MALDHMSDLAANCQLGDGNQAKKVHQQAIATAINQRLGLNLTAAQVLTHLRNVSFPPLHPSPLISVVLTHCGV